jgi:acetyl-CoA C-acetyltransferase
MAQGIRDRVAIIGMGCTRFGDLWDRSTDDLIVEAAHAALGAAGIGLDEVDAFWLGTTRSGNSGLTLSRPLKIPYKPVTRVENYCATGSEALRAAAYAVAAGAYDVAMAVGVEKLKDFPYAGLVSSNPPSDGTATESTAPALFSVLAPAYAERYDLTTDEMREVMTHIAWKNHRNGARNPLAQFRREVPKETISAAPRVAGDLRLFDCSGMADGAAAAIVVRSEDAHRFLPKPLFVKALSLAASPHPGINNPEYDFTTFPEVVASVGAAYREAGLERPLDRLGLAEVHDCFTPTELLLMEDLGFSGRGRAWQDVLGGRYDADGALPVNPDGGLKSFGHPVGASGLRMLYECWLQLRGEAGDRQLSGIGSGTPRTLGLTQNLGGSPGDCVSFVSIVGTELD